MDPAGEDLAGEGLAAGDIDPATVNAEEDDEARLPEVAEESGEAVADLLLAGCSHELAPNVEALIQNGTPTHSERAWFGRPALAVRFTLRPATSMTLYLAPKTDAVFGLAVHFPHVRGWSRIRPLPLTPARLALFEGR